MPRRGGNELAGAPAAPAGRLGAGRRRVVVLVALSGLFLAGLALQRSRSGFLRAEARTEEARQVADETGLRPEQVLALLELDDGALDPAELRTEARDLAAQRDRLGDVLLAVLAVRGKPELARRLRAEAGADRERIEARVRSCREAVEIAVRFASVAERYRARLAGR